MNLFNNTMKYFIFLILTVSALSCASKQSDIKKEDNKDVKKEENKDIKRDDWKNMKTELEDYQTILQAEPKMEWVFGKNYKNWTPSLNDIIIAEAILKTAFNDQKRGTVNRLLGRSPDEYFRQFVGAETESGEKIVWINCFCKKELDSFKEWKTNLVYVADGGNCFFNVKANITKNIYTEMNVNGLP